MTEYDTLIVGGGLAGLCAALLLAPTRRVALLCKTTLDAGASGLAQGGIAAVLDAHDSFEAHVQDTLVAGAGLCDEAATRFIVEAAPAAMAWLQAQGVPFTLEDGALHLTREGGHSARRIAHVADATGAAVQRTLIEALRRSPGITVLEQHSLIDLLLAAPNADGAARRCLGVEVLDERRGLRRRLRATHTLLASGGAGQVFQHTTNPETSTGDGIAAAWRAGCRVANLEFIQFHPTSLYHPEAQGFLISEAVRGEGGLLKRPAAAGGERFMPEHDARAELAPRDVVARAIDAEMKRHGLPCVELDISHQGADFVRQHFPNIAARCATLGLDITRQPIPVVPAAHYTCGGVLTDLDARTDLPGLLALGEVACTGLHGANRLASNSLLECLVLAQAAARSVLADADAAPPCPSADEPPETTALPAPEAASEAEAAALRQQLRALMSAQVGIVRSDASLSAAARALEPLQAASARLWALGRPSRALLELRNLVEVATLIVRSARQRRESRGLHFSTDHPHTGAEARPSVLQAP